MAIDVGLNSTWKYVSDEGGRNDVHVVIEIGNDEIITCSYINEKAGARSFMGTRARFLRDFKPVNPIMWIWPFKKP